MESKYLDVLGLVRVPVRDGELYLYPEYTGMTERFVQGGEETPLGSSTRNILLVTPQDGSGAYVAKQERPKDDRFFIKWPHKIPSHGNVSVREVSVARALSSLAEFENYGFFVRFERPFGYLQRGSGERVTFFQYEPMVNSGRGEPDELKKIKAILRKQELKKQRLEGRGGGVYVDGTVLSLAYFEMEGKIAKELFFAGILSRIAMRANGVDHNELGYTYAFQSMDDAGRCGTFAMDFEQVNPYDGDGAICKKDISELRSLVEGHTRIEEMWGPEKRGRWKTLARFSRTYRESGALMESLNGRIARLEEAADCVLENREARDMIDQVFQMSDPGQLVL